MVAALVGAVFVMAACGGTASTDIVPTIAPTTSPSPEPAVAPAVTPRPSPEPTSSPVATPTPPRRNVSVGSALDQLASPFVLPSATGPSYALETFRGDRNVVVVFYRAFW